MIEASGFESLAQSLTEIGGWAGFKPCHRVEVRAVQPDPGVFMYHGQFKPGHQAEVRHDQPGSPISAFRSGEAVRPGQRHRATLPLFVARPCGFCIGCADGGPTWRTRRSGSVARSCRAWQQSDSRQFTPPDRTSKGRRGDSRAGRPKTADSNPRAPCVTRRSRWRPHTTTKPATGRAKHTQSPAVARFKGWPGFDSARTDSAQIQAGKRYRTISAQPHNPAQLFLPIVAQRCKIMLAIRGERSYLGL
jgi:hypothetical protein